MAPLFTEAIVLIMKWVGFEGCVGDVVLQEFFQGHPTAKARGRIGLPAHLDGLGDGLAGAGGRAGVCGPLFIAFEGTGAEGV
tara:strand:+ start:965 stop:1210 length:246 start_codon:yes stop_codon:yes gene_type:complete